MVFASSSQEAVGSSYQLILIGSLEEIPEQIIDVSGAQNGKSDAVEASPHQSTPDGAVLGWANFAILIGLYIIQGIPLGLVFGAIPYILKSMKSNNLSYKHFGLFSLAGYPYSLKLLWSPLVDYFYNERVGRRKSWILPTQILVGCLFYVVGSQIDAWIVPGKPVNFWRLNSCFLVLVSLCATLDIAVDGWALTLLPASKLHYASTCQSVGINIGLFISFTIFLAFSSGRFCTEFLGMKQENGLFTLGGFMRFWSVIYFVATFALLFKREVLPESLKRKLNSNKDKSTWQIILSAYKTLRNLLKMPSVKSLAVILLTFKFGFSAYDAVAPLKLLEKGFPREYLALTVLIDFPFQMIFGFIVAKWASGSNTLRPWVIATYCRIVMSFVGLYVISRYPTTGLTTSYTIAIITTTVLTSIWHTTMYVSLGAYFIRISDPKYGGTYLTLLNTLSNFAGMWPKLPVMSAVDWLTIKRCHGVTAIKSTLGPMARACAGNAGRNSCERAGGSCQVEADGFYFTAAACLIFGFFLFHWWIRPAVERLQTIPQNKWIVQSRSVEAASNPAGAEAVSNLKTEESASNRN